jgi:outer membrane protein assembly factor BamA
MNLNCIKYLLFFSILCNTLIAQFTIDTSKRVNYLAIPVLFRTPETGWAYGLSSSLTFKTSNKHDTLTRTSVIQGLAIFSQKEQNIQAIDASIYFPKEKYILYFQSNHSYFPDVFWGIGSNTENSNEEKYAFEQFNSSIHLKKKIAKHLFFGLMADYQNVLQLKYGANSLLDQISLFGKTPYHVLGFGITTSYDTRNFTFWPTKGMFLQAQATSYNKGIASDLSFNKVILEGRFFKSIYKNQILAFQFYNHSTIGDTPFRSLATLGGTTNLRGFYQGRFKDKSMVSFIAEYRTFLVWKLSAVAFIGVGNVYQSIHTIQSSSIKHSFGGGLRISILEKDKLNLRIDYGYSDKYNKGFYFTLGECF